jgi:hypothetical protein
MAQIEKKDVGSIVITMFIFGFLAIAAIFASGGLAVIAIKWFFSLVKGGL